MKENSGSTDGEPLRIAILGSGDQQIPLGLTDADCRLFDFSVGEVSTDIELRNIGNRLITGEIDILLFRTSWGFRRFVETTARFIDKARLKDSLSDADLIAGSQSVAQEMIREGIQPELTFDESQSWRDILIRMETEFKLPNLTVAIESSADVYSIAAGLEARGAAVACIHLVRFNDSPSDAERDLLHWLSQTQIDALVLASNPATIRYARLQDTVAQSDRPGLLVSLPSTVETALDHRLDVKSLGPLENLRAAELHDRNQAGSGNIVNSSQTNESTGMPPAWHNSPFMRAIRLEPNTVTPIWMMRQAGRYMQEYRAVRDKVSFLELCHDPALCSEVMCTAVQRLGVDAAIIFSDLLPLLVPMGMDLEFLPGDGPVIHNPIRTTTDLDRVRPLDSVDSLSFVMETVRQTRADLPEDMPLIGFAGAPFTLASYMIEGGSSRNYAYAKRFMYADPAAWDQLMEHLVHSISIYLIGQIEAGAQCVQLFDSWAGCLNAADYERYVLPHVDRIIEQVAPHAPVINFATGNPELLPLLARTRAAVIGVDWRVELASAWQTIGSNRAIQGNLDPTVLLTNPQVIRQHVQRILDQAAGRPGHIFNLGHGILPTTPVDNAIALVDAVHELSQR